MAYLFSPPIAQPQIIDGTQLSPGHHVLTHAQIPGAWFGYGKLARMRWNDQQITLPEDPHRTLFTLRAQDIPDFPRVKKGPTTRFPMQRGPGSLVIRNQLGQTRLFSPPGAKNTIGGSLSWSVQLDSQLPSLTCCFQRHSAGFIVNHRVTLYGNTGLEDVEYHNPESIKAGDLRFVRSEFTEAIAQGRSVV